MIAGSGSHGDRTRVSFSLAVAIAVVAVAAAVRAPFLGGHGIDDDEFYTLRNALEFFADPTPAAVARYPLLFLVTRLGIELSGVAPLALRWFPFLCGVLAVPLLICRGRRLVSPSAALAAACVLAVWPWHQYWSGNARYYAPLFLGGIGMIDSLERVLDRRRDAHVELALWLVAAMLVHPAALLGLFGAAALVLDPERRRRAGRATLLAFAGVAVALPLSLKLSGTWENVARVLSKEGGEGADAVQLVLNLAFNLSPPLLALAFLGLIAAWREARSRAIYLLCAGALPIALLAVLAAFGQGVQGRYAMAGFPALVLLAGRGVAALVERAPGTATRFAAGFACLASFIPGLVSNLADGDRHDIAGAARQVASRLDGRERLYAESHGLLGVYLFGVDRRLPAGCGEPPFPSYFGEAPPPVAELDTIVAEGLHALIVVPERALSAGGGGADGVFARWLREHARVVGRAGGRRYDYHRNGLVFLAVGGAA